MPDGLVIGVDLGGTKLLAGAVGPDLAVHHRAQRPAPPRDLGAVLDAIAAAVDEVARAVSEPVSAVGIGIPSLMDQRRRIAVSTVHLPIADVPFADVMSERLGRRVVVDNDANCAGLAELRAGAARGARHALVLTLGTGIGGAILAEGQLLRGAVGSAGELGHMVVDLDGPACFGSCPGRGCLEALASGSALGRDALIAAHAHPGSALGTALAAGRPVTGALVTELAHDGDPVACEVLTAMGAKLGVGISSLVNVFNPEVVVVGGGVMAAGELLLSPARAQVAATALSPSREAVRVVAAHFGADSGMLGASILAREAA